MPAHNKLSNEHPKDIRDLNTTLAGVTKQLGRIAQHLESIRNMVNNAPGQRE